ncbi:hypothetical protein BH11ARM2_BH11ARM2_36990 [soil metagenome]
MTKKILSLLLPLFAVASLVGCNGSEKVEPEPAMVQAKAQEAASQWTPEQKATMQKALANRRSDDGGKGK